MTVRSNNATLYKLHTNKKGGDVRVSELSFTNEFGEYSKTKYTYAQEDGISSGVVAKEPEFIKDQYNADNFGLDNLYDSPSTSVMYSRVTVSSGYNRLSNTYSAKQVYEFETPDKDFVLDSNVKLNDYVVPNFYYRLTDVIASPAPVYFKQYLNRIEIRNSRIGKLKSMQILDGSDSLIERTDLNYTEDTPSNQGKYTSGNLLSEVTTSGEFFDHYVMKLIRTNKTVYPYVLSGIVRTKDGLTETKEFKAWDFFTGEPTVTETKSMSGIRTRDESIPAYAIQYTSGSSTVNPYGAMGLKGFDITNANMVNQVGATYSFLLDGDGQKLGLLGAGVSTWKGDWSNYRIYNSSLGTYGDGSEGRNVWRAYSTYNWLGDYSRHRSDGTMTFSDADRFDFNPSSSNVRWKETGSVHRYDHFSAPLAISAVPGAESSRLYSSLRMGYGDKFRIAEAVDADLQEMAFSSAEDLQTNGYFGGEVALGNGTVNQGVSHTGNNSLSLSSGNGFKYTAGGLRANRFYKISVWTNSVSGRIYYKINNGAEVLSVAPTDRYKVGDWYLVNLLVPPQASSISLEVGVKVAAGSALFDDFRFQPADSQMQCYVYDPATYSITYVLDNDNMYTKYEYDDRGFLRRTYQESIKYGVKMISESKDDFRRFHVDQ